MPRMQFAVLAQGEGQAERATKEGEGMKTAAVYCRVSTEDQEREGTSLQTQLQACLRYCRERGYDADYQFTETYSGLTLERPRLNELRELVRNERVDVIVFYSLDRLSRDPTHGVIIQEELAKHNIGLEAVSETVESTELGKLISYIRGFASKLEVEKIRERTMRGKKAKALEGKIPHGGFAHLYGCAYDKIRKKRVVNETEAYWVRQIYDWLVNEGMCTNSITQKLRALNAPTKRSQHWNRSTVLGILKNPAYTGKTYAFTTYTGKTVRKPQNEWIEIPDATPVLITEEVFQAAQKQLQLNYQRAKRNTKQQYLLRSHVYCRQCGRAYCGQVNRTSRYYRCLGKQRMTVPVNRCLNRYWSADKLEALIWKEIERVLDNPELIIKEIEKHRDDANHLGVSETELQQVERQLKEIERDQEQLLQWALKGFPEETVLAENKKINNKRETLKASKAELEAQIKASQEAAVSLPKLEQSVELIRDTISALDFEAKRMALDALSIKVWLDGDHVEVIGVIPVEDAAIVTTQS